MCKLWILQHVLCKPSGGTGAATMDYVLLAARSLHTPAGGTGAALDLHLADIFGMNQQLLFPAYSPAEEWGG